MSLFNRLFATARAPAPDGFDAPLAPQEPFYAIGDIHGCETLLECLFEKIEAEPTTPQHRVICVGDYVDRGESSAGVLRWLSALDQDDDVALTCLMGNHEDMLLKFLDDPEGRGPRWLRFGGLQTLASFGVGGVGETSTGAALVDARDDLAEAMGDDLIAWLRGLPTLWQTGNVAVVHAGADPTLPMTDQEPRTLKWSHRDFHRVARKDGTWVVHGHTIVDDAVAEQGRIAIDTGAYATGRLTAAHISADGVRFLQTP